MGSRSENTISIIIRMHKFHPVFLKLLIVMLTGNSDLLTVVCYAHWSVILFSYSLHE